MKRIAVWTGRILSTLVLVPLVFGVMMSFSGNPKIAEGMAHAGIPLSLMKTLMVLELSVIVLYAIPATSVVGAILFTGYMGGAICTHLRLGESVFIQTLLPILAWLGLYLREPRLRSILPLR